MNDPITSLTALANDLEKALKLNRSSKFKASKTQIAELRAATAEMSSLRQLFADLQNGERVILPTTREHAWAMYRVAFDALQHIKPADQHPGETKGQGQG